MKIKSTIRAFVLLLVIGASAMPSGGDASGCSYYSGSPSWFGCGGGGGGCYACEYSSHGGYTQCFENPSGSVAYCTDFQF